MKMVVFKKGLITSHVSFYYWCNAMLARVLAIALGLCLSQVGVLSK